MSIRPLVLVFFAATLAGLFLSGCVAAPDSGGGDSSEPSERTEGSEPAAGSGGSRPPESTLSYGGQSVSGGLGGYCWTSPSVSRCTEAAGVPITEEALTVPAGSTLTFAYGGRKLDSLDVTAYRIYRGSRLERIAGGSVLVVPNEEGEGYKAIKLPTRRFGNRARIVAELPAGEYAVEAFARMPQGDAFYGFRVVVE